MRRRIRLAGTEGADRGRDFKRIWLAAALCALAVSAAGCGSSGKGGEDQEVAWETREKDGEEDAGNASDASNETGEREGKESGENGGEGQSAEGETAGEKPGRKTLLQGKKRAAKTRMEPPRHGKMRRPAMEPWPPVQRIWNIPSRNGSTSPRWRTW